MAYTTPDQLRLVLSPDGDETDLSTAASLDDQTLQGPCQQASDEIDARLAARYPTPLVGPVPTVVVSIATDIAAYLATLVFRKGQPVESTDPVYLRHQRSVAFLRDIARGDANLNIAASASPQGQVVVSNPVHSPLFGPEDFDLVPDASGRLSADRFGPGIWH